jgi:hypothetical protein
MAGTWFGNCIALERIHRAHKGLRIGNWKQFVLMGPKIKEI